VLSSGERACHFCDHPEISSLAESPASTQGNLALRLSGEEEWRGELNQRLQALPCAPQEGLPQRSTDRTPFESRRAESSVAVHTEEPQVIAHDPNDDFAFTIAIGRPPQKTEPDDARLMIDVSLPPLSADPEEAPEAPEEPPSDLYRSPRCANAAALH